MKSKVSKLLIVVITYLCLFSCSNKRLIEVPNKYFSVFPLDNIEKINIFSDSQLGSLDTITPYKTIIKEDEIIDFASNFSKVRSTPFVIVVVEYKVHIVYPDTIINITIGSDGYLRTKEGAFKAPVDLSLKIEELVRVENPT